MRMTAIKRVLVLSSGECDELSGILRGGGWELLKPDRDENPGSDQQANPCNVGLVCIPDAEPQWMAVADRLARTHDDVSWIAVVGRSAVAHEQVRAFIAAHCVDYQTEPVEPARLSFALGHADGMARLSRLSRGGAGHDDDLRPVILGGSEAMVALRRAVAEAARVDDPVLITGESGTGKGLAAESIHRLSSRRNSPFVAVNCTALAAVQLRAELLGRGREESDATLRPAREYLQAADRGTILFDEIGDLQPESQAMMLRFTERADSVRMVATTNTDLDAGVQQGRFREDLFHRLNVIRLHIPPLRERRDDIEPLANAFLDRLATRHRAHCRDLSPAAMEAMMRHDWPGNVRELHNRVTRAVVLAEGRWITPGDLDIPVGRSGGELPKLRIARGKAERDTILGALHRTRWNASQSAKLLGVSRATLYRMLGKHGLLVSETEPETGCAAPARDGKRRYRMAFDVSQ
jgi:DNA-binding NtrC family response regulator